MSKIDLFSQHIELLSILRFLQFAHKHLSEEEFKKLIKIYAKFTKEEK